MNPLWQDTLLLTLLHEGGLFRLGSHFAQQNAYCANQPINNGRSAFNGSPLAFCGTTTYCFDK